jgi:hypothetical protein
MHNNTMMQANDNPSVYEYPSPPPKAHRLVKVTMKKKHSFSPAPRLQRRKDGLHAWHVGLLMLVVLFMNFQTFMQSRQSDMMTSLKRRTSVPPSSDSQRLSSEVAKVTQVEVIKSLSPSKKQNRKEKEKKQIRLPLPPRPKVLPKDLVKSGDYIYYRGEGALRWDAAPVVIESHKLLFFTIPKVGCTVWKQLFRRMMGYEDWKSQDYTKLLPHDPETNGLKYLYHYSLEEANTMMTSPDWTRAIMVRDPKLRFLSAFLDKAVSNDHIHIINRCCPDESCVEDAQTIPGFLQLVRVCDDEHWRGQDQRVDAKYWPYMDWVGYVETAASDAETLLRKIGAWEEFGKSGWGDDGKNAIFQSTEQTGAGVHATWSQHKVWQWYTPESEKLVERYYQADYTNPLFKYERGHCLTCVKDN